MRAAAQHDAAVMHASDAAPDGSHGGAAGASGASDAGRGMARNDAGNAGKPQQPGRSATDSGTAAGPARTDAASTDAGSSDAPSGDAGAVRDAAVGRGSPLVVGVGSWGLRGRSSDGAAFSYCGNPSTGDDHSPDLLRNVAYGDGVFIAVGGDANSMVMRSLDGAHWQEDLHATTSCAGEAYPASCQNWMGGVAYGAGVWLAGGGNGALMRSRDAGQTWTGLHPQPTPSPIRDLSYGDGRFVGGTDQGFVIVSDDAGDSWTEHALWNYDTQIAYGGGAFIAWGAHWNGSAFDRACFVSVDGAQNFTACAAEVASASSFAHDGTRWVAATGSSYMTSSDAQSWTSHSAANVPSSLLYLGSSWLGQQGSAVWRADSLDDWQRAATGVPDFRAWTAGLVLDANLPVQGVAECQDRR
jgi:hypothetical protein